MERDHGLAGRLLAYGVLDNRIPPLWETRPQDFPLAGEILRLAESLVVHSRYVEEGARASGYEGPIARIPHPAWRRETAPAPDAPLIGCFGHVNESKRIPQLFAAFERVREARPDAELLVVGGASSRLANLDVPEGVMREGYADEERLWSLMGTCEVIVSLRSPTMGETSGTVIRALSIGRPLVVSDVGWFSELPDSVAVKVPPDEREVNTLAAELERLLNDQDTRREMSAAALELATTEHRLDRVAELYAATLEETAGGGAVREAVTREVAAAAAEVGIGPDDPEAKELAARLREAELG
jgi:glycosyltransferase involved in cell wall biosynthesis